MLGNEMILLASGMLSKVVNYSDVEKAWVQMFKKE